MSRLFESHDEMMEYLASIRWPVLVTESGGQIWGTLVRWHRKRWRRSAYGDVMFRDYEEGEFLTYPAEYIEVRSIPL